MASYETFEKYEQYKPPFNDVIQPAVIPDPDGTSIRVRSHWMDYNRQELIMWAKRGTLRPHLQCLYDTLILGQGAPIEAGLTEQRAFIVPLGQQGKTIADTNMWIGSSLGTPLMAHWKHLRVHIEKYGSVEDVNQWKEKAEIELVYGQNTPIWRGSPGVMGPILPKGGRKKVASFIRQGRLKVWPWLEAPINCIIGSTDVFYVRVQYSSPFTVECPMRIKISLGPTLYKTVP